MRNRYANGICVELCISSKDSCIVHGYHGTRILDRESIHNTCPFGHSLQKITLTNISIIFSPCFFTTLLTTIHLIRKFYSNMQNYKSYLKFL
uniref:Uncharacterized protein n=1 Tax=Oryza brachyantha TaxID=4533 RepID=J3KUY1_ORYBR